MKVFHGTPKTWRLFIHRAWSLRKDDHLCKLIPTLSPGSYLLNCAHGLQLIPLRTCRTDLRVVRMTELYDVRSYMMLHKALGLNETNPMACPPRLFTKPTIEDLWNCKRSFPGLGNTEVAIKVTALDEKSGKNVTSLAYAPYMEAPYRSWGPWVRKDPNHVD